ncbi:transglycosylase family protein [Streptomyces sp. NPDC050636]|uniref:transglycosylase family protein n=1 Tax=Streptomyces sp. NPDC050636 TaxID=3154510 RepID=UPI003441EADF
MSSRHAKRSVEAILSMVLVLLGGLGLAGQSAVAATAAPPPGGTNWRKIAACESSGRWHINTGNGYYGGLQIHPSTWRAYGGHRYALRPDLATRAQQIAVGERIVRHRGLAPWPHCGHHGATSSRNSNSNSNSNRDSADDNADEARSAAHRRTSGSTAPPHRTHHRLGTTARAYVVQPGDCLSVIAERTDIRGGTRALYERNKDKLDEGPDRIYPGQRLRLRR